MKHAIGTYEALFSRIARKYKELNLASKQLTENEYKNFILNEYTFLKRPVIFIGKKIISVTSTGIGPDNIDIVLNELDALVNIDFENRTINFYKICCCYFNSDFSLRKRNFSI